MRTFVTLLSAIIIVSSATGRSIKDIITSESNLCDYIAPGVEIVYPPVYPFDPLKTDAGQLASVDLIIDATGAVKAAGFDKEADPTITSLSQSALQHWKFTPALYCDVPSTGFLRAAFSDYLFLKEPQSDETIVAPIALWALSQELYNRYWGEISFILRLKKDDDQQFIEAHIQIDADGNVVDIKGKSKLDRLIIDHVIRPIFSTFKFRPATQNGVPIPSTIVYRSNFEYDRFNLDEARDYKPTPKFPKEWIYGTEPIELTFSCGIGFDGRLARALYTGEDYPSLAQYALMYLRLWEFEKKEGANGSTATIKVLFDPESKSAHVISTVIDEMNFPEAVRQIAPVYPVKDKRDRLEGIAVVSFEVTENGNTTNVKVAHATTSSFAAASVDAVKKWKFKPGLNNGNPVRFKMRVPLIFSIN